MFDKSLAKVKVVVDTYLVQQNLVGIKSVSNRNKIWLSRNKRSFSIYHRQLYQNTHKTHFPEPPPIESEKSILVIDNNLFTQDIPQQIYKNHSRSMLNIRTFSLKKMQH
ncbi:unnamed protein product [Vicia faba]|uniref:Uncharacterized protein n=1 Tax=Vicia faba TaxID=3906 RepID=A0AAV1ALV6_VICFA|nr:unnamed protein product [Vicia faba]